MSFILRNLRKITDAPYSATGAVQYYAYATPDTVATVLTAGYFNDARARLNVNDVILATCAADATGDAVQMKVTAVPASPSNITVSTETEVQANRAVTAADAAAAGNSLSAGDRKVDVTSGNAAHFIVLPPIVDMAINDTIRLSVGANGHELRTVAASNTKINNVDADGSQQMAVPANSITVVTKQGADNFIAEVYVVAGTRTIPTPD